MRKYVALFTILCTVCFSCYVTGNNVHYNPHVVQENETLGSFITEFFSPTDIDDKNKFANSQDTIVILLTLSLAYTVNCFVQLIKRLLFLKTLFYQSNFVVLSLL